MDKIPWYINLLAIVCGIAGGLAVGYAIWWVANLFA